MRRLFEERLKNSECRCLAPINVDDSELETQIRDELDSIKDKLDFY